MSTALFPRPNGTLLVAGLALAALWFYSRQARAQTPASTGRAVAGRAYDTPTSVGEQLARGVVGMLSGFLPGPPKTDRTGNVTDRDALRRVDRQIDPYWSGPTDSAVDSNITAAAYSGQQWDQAGQVDSAPIAPVFDPTFDVYDTRFYRGIP